MQDYTGYGEKCLVEGENLLKEDDFAQGGEKPWGACTQYVKAYAEKNGWKHDGHRELFKVINNIAKESGDNEFNDLFSFANFLHVNFYEHWLTDEQVKRHADKAKKLIEKLRNLIDKKGGAR